MLGGVLVLEKAELCCSAEGLTAMVSPLLYLRPPRLLAKALPVRKRLPFPRAPLTRDQTDLLLSFGDNFGMALLG